MRDIKQKLRHIIDGHQTNWDQDLLLIQDCYNTTVNITTGFTPYFLRYGIEFLEEDEDWVNKKFLENDYQVNMNQILNLLGTEMDNNYNKMNKYLQKGKKSDEIINKGDYVFVKNVKNNLYINKKQRVKSLLNKLAIKFNGPYYVHKKISDIVYELNIHGTITKVSLVNMKKFQYESFYL
jgi:hypothetical protein